jgi:hypothetical protein
MPAFAASAHRLAVGFGAAERNAPVPVTTRITVEFLERERRAIVDAAAAGLARLHARHYEAAGESEVHRRLEALFDRVLGALAGRDVGGMVSYAEEVAEERYNAGYDLSEVQTAFNALEEAMWTRAVAEVEPSELAAVLGLTSTILGAGKDALARRYVSLSAGTHAPSLDLRALFAGTAGS